MALPVNKILCGDCLEVLRDWPDNCVDLVFCSPPYEDARFYDELKFKLKGQDWVNWALYRFIECVRVCKGLVCWVVEGKTRQFRWSATPTLLMADLHRSGVHLRKPPAFRRIGIPGSGGPDWLRNDYEFIICATSGGKLPWSDNKAMGHPPKWKPGGPMSNRTKSGRRVNEKPAYPRNRKSDGTREVRSYFVPDKANPGNIINCGVMGGGHLDSKLAHENEAPFPERLAGFFIRSFCPSDGIVLDPFSGSGTTVAAAEKLSRRWIAIDIRQSQCDLTQKRLNEAKQETKELFR